jgi:uncharacterized protein YeaO (DUF488 family)
MLGGSANLKSPTLTLRIPPASAGGGCQDVYSTAFSSEPESVCSASGDISVMAEFDPEQFEDKYANYFAELQRAYKNAFESMNNRYDSELIHAIDQQILNESEPFYDTETDSFEIQLPENPTDRLTAIVVDDQKLQTVLETYVDELQQQHRRVFRLDDESEPKV